jgi:hypothetical protein
MQANTGCHHFIFLLGQAFLWVAALTCMLLEAGCIVLPIPHEETVLYGNQVESPQLQTFQLGLTTQADVEEKLGPPEVFWLDQRIAYYRWDVSTWSVLFVACGGYTCAGGFNDLKDIKLLLVQYDEASNLKRFEIRSCENFGAVGKELKKWADEGKKP